MKTFPGSHVLTAHHGRSAGRHWSRFNLSAQPKLQPRPFDASRSWSTLDRRLREEPGLQRPRKWTLAFRQGSREAQASGCWTPALWRPWLIWKRPCA